MSRENERELSPTQGKAIAVTVAGIVIIALVFVIVKIDRWNADSLEKETRKEEAQTEAFEWQEDIDALCGERLTQYSTSGTLDLEQFLYAYGFTATENGWVGENGRLLFDYSSSETAPTMRYKFDDSGKEYERTVSCDGPAVDNVPVKIGARNWTMSRNDLTALGRIIMNDPDDFQLSQTD